MSTSVRREHKRERQRTSADVIFCGAPNCWALNRWSNTSCDGPGSCLMRASIPGVQSSDDVGTL
jgi:hypothetical protein